MGKKIRGEKKIIWTLMVLFLIIGFPISVKNYLSEVPEIPGKIFSVHTDSVPTTYFASASIDFVLFGITLIFVLLNKITHKLLF